MTLDRIKGGDFTGAVAEALDDGGSFFRTAIFYLGVAAGQSYSRGLKKSEVDELLTHFSERYPRVATDIRKELDALTTQPTDNASASQSEEVKA